MNAVGRRLLVALVTLSMAASLQLSAPAASSAHSAASFYTEGGWLVTFVHMTFRDAFPTGSARTAVMNGFSNFNAATDGNTPKYTFDGQTTADGNYGDPCAAGFNGIY